MRDSLQNVVVGGGQAGLAAGYFLAKRGDRFTILDENSRTGEAWRSRWDSLRLFTPSKYNGLPGMAFPKADFYFPTKEEVADYLEEYAGRFNLPVQHSVRVEALTRSSGGYQLSTSSGSLQARNVIVATGPYQRPHTPSFARELDPGIFQIHSSAYRNSEQVRVQNVVVVGAGNSGAEIALDLRRAGKRVWLAGRNVGRIPADRLGRAFGGRLYWWFISRVLSVDTPIGRKMKSDVLFHGAPLIRASRQEVAHAGIQSAARVSNVVSGELQLEDGRKLRADGIVWATGFRPDFKWINLPVFDDHGYPRHKRGIVEGTPGLYFVGLPFQTALSSALLGGVGSEASYVVKQMPG